VARIYSSVLLEWKGDTVRLRNGGPVVKVERDTKYPGMYRVRTPDGKLSDMINRSRARDAAGVALLRILNSEETAQGASPAFP
jgi:hypothetical protein